MRNKILILVAAVLIGLVSAWTSLAQYSVPCYREAGGEKWVAGLLGSTGCEWEMQSGATLDVQSGVTETHANNVTFSGTVTQSGSVVMSGLPYFPPQSEVVAAGFTITPTSRVVVLTSAAAVTSSATLAIITSTINAGTPLILRNGNASDVITIDGTGGTIECKANVALGASDTLTLVYNGLVWNCLSSYDNS